MGIKDTACEGVDWINLAQDSIQLQTTVNTTVNFHVPQKTRNFLTS